MYAKKESRYPAYFSKHNSNHEKQVIILMIWNRKLSAILTGISSEHEGDLYCLNCRYSFRTKSKLELFEKVSKNKIFCNILMSFEDTEILQFKQHQKSDKVPFFLHVKCLIEKIDGCKNNPENSSTTKASEHISSDALMSTTWAFKSLENKHDV